MQPELDRSVGSHDDHPIGLDALQPPAGQCISELEAGDSICAQTMNERDSTVIAIGTPASANFGAARGIGAPAPEDVGSAGSRLPPSGFTARRRNHGPLGDAHS
jgi:hypothetical protein